MVDMKTLTIDSQQFEIVDAEARSDIASLQAAVGSPLVASTASAMTDHNKVYVYTGSESGYTSGNWYYWNGSAWTSGGVYNAAAISTDKTLSVADQAADAEKTGDALAALQSAISEKVNLPVENPDGTEGQVLMTNGDGSTTWGDVLLDVNTAEMNISVDGNDELLQILQKICDKIGLDYTMPLYASFKGFITPFDGAYSDWMYDNMVPVGNNIYMIYVYMQSHYNSVGESKKSRFVCYDTETEEVTFTKECMYNGNHFDAWILKYIDGVFYAWDSAGYRYATTDFGNTWTREQCTGKPVDETHYTVTTHTGRIIGCPHSYDRKYYLYSDDNGLTWNKVDNPYGNYTNGRQYICSHNTLYEVDNKVVAYLSAPFEQGATFNGVRYVSVSEDDGLTWSEPTACTGDLANAGATYTCGQIMHFAGEYHYITDYRYSSNGIGGYVKWYKGSKEDLINGTLSLVETIYTHYGNDGRRDDFGNGGGCVCNGAMYINVATMLNPSWQQNYSLCSNQGIKLFKIGTSEESDTVVSEWDENYLEKYNTLLSEKSTNPKYYFYNGEQNLSDTTDRRYHTLPTPVVNFGGVQFGAVGVDSKTYLPDSPILRYDVDNKDFEVNIVFGHFFSNNFGQTTTKPYVILGFEQADGTIHCILHNKPYSYSCVFNTAETSGYAAAMLPAQANNIVSNICATIKRVNGDLYFEINGVTIKNPVYSNIQENSRFQSNTGKDNVFISLIGNDGNTTEYENWFTTNKTTYSTTYSGFSLLTIDY